MSKVKAGQFLSQPHYQLPTPQVFEVTQITQVLTHPPFTLLLRSNGSIFTPHSPVCTYLRVSYIAMNSWAVMLITEQGSVYMMGEDPMNYGVLGAYTKLKNPKLLADLNATKGDLGTSHAAVVDSKGQLYTWGTGYFGQLGLLNNSKCSINPSIVEDAKIFSSKQVVCGDAYTCVCTQGGYLYLYGAIGTVHPKRLQSPQASPQKKITAAYTIPELEKYFCTLVSGGLNYISILTELGEVFVVDECRDLVKLPLSEGVVIKQLASTNFSLYGLTKQGKTLYEWALRKAENSSLCTLANWSAKVYQLADDYSSKICLFSSKSDYISFTFKETPNKPPRLLGTLESTLGPYKRSEFAIKLCESVSENINYELSPESPSRWRDRRTSSFEDLERLYGSNQDTIEKIIQVRTQHKQSEKLIESLSPPLHPLIKSVFRKLKRFSRLKKACLSASNYMLMSMTLAKTVENWKVRTIAYSFQKLSKLSALKVSKENSVKPICSVLTTRVFKLQLCVLTNLKLYNNSQKLSSLLLIKHLALKLNQKALRQKFSLWSKRVQALKTLKKALDKLTFQLAKALRRNNNIVFIKFKLRIGKKQKLLNQLLKTFQRYEVYLQKKAVSTWSTKIWNSKLSSMKFKYCRKIITQAFLHAKKCAEFSSLQKAFNQLLEVTKKAKDSKNLLKILSKLYSGNLLTQKTNFLKKLSVNCQVQRKSQSLDILKRVLEAKLLNYFKSIQTKQPSQNSIKLFIALKALFYKVTFRNLNVSWMKLKSIYTSKTDILSYLSKAPDSSCVSSFSGSDKSVTLSPVPSLNLKLTGSCQSSGLKSSTPKFFSENKKKSFKLIRKKRNSCNYQKEISKDPKKEVKPPWKPSGSNSHRKSGSPNRAKEYDRKLKRRQQLIRAKKEGTPEQRSHLVSSRNSSPHYIPVYLRKRQSLNSNISLGILSLQKVTRTLRLKKSFSVLKSLNYTKLF